MDVRSSADCIDSTTHNKRVFRHQLAHDLEDNMGDQKFMIIFNACVLKINRLNTKAKRSTRYGDSRVQPYRGTAPVGRCLTDLDQSNCRYIIQTLFWHNFYSRYLSIARWRRPKYLYSLAAGWRGVIYA